MSTLYETVIGLEVHVQVLTHSKLFCTCKTDFGAPPNSQICPICLGLPGVLPLLNKKAMELLVKTGLALGATISPHSKFDRKNYFYPDLPKNYQISQYDLPLSQGGKIEIEMDGVKKSIGLTRIHLEEDAGKLIHEDGGAASWVDLNRTGVPLMEMVSEPDMRSPQEAFEYLRTLKQILLYLEVSDCNMEEGSLRCDANVSLRPVGKKEYGTKVEIKNLNSFTNVRKALAYEVKRQSGLLEEGQKILQETRLWDAQKDQTSPMRSKESAHDYRYFPEPDLVPIAMDKPTIEKMRATIPEMPAQRRERFLKQYLLPAYDAGVLTSDKDLADYFEQCATLLPPLTPPDGFRLSAPTTSSSTPKAFGVPGLGRKVGELSCLADTKSIANWIMTELLGHLNDAKKSIKQSPVTPRSLAGMLKLIKDGTISGKIAKDLFQRMFQTGRPPEMIVKEEGLIQITNESDIIGAVGEAIKEAGSVVADYKSGKTAALGFLVGQVMKKTKGKANPQVVNKLLKEALDR